jgi:hypothetical protein
VIGYQTVFTLGHITWHDGNVISDITARTRQWASARSVLGFLRCFGRVQNRYVLLARFPPAGSACASWPSAWVTSLGMIQTLFDSPCAICGSTCRYW